MLFRVATFSPRAITAAACGFRETADYATARAKRGLKISDWLSGIPIMPVHVRENFPPLNGNAWWRSLLPGIFHLPSNIADCSEGFRLLYRQFIPLFSMLSDRRAGGFYSLVVEFLRVRLRRFLDYIFDTERSMVNDLVLLPLGES